MKLFTIILTTIVIFLAFKPGIDLIALHFGKALSCCSTNCTPSAENGPFSDQRPYDDCDGNGCNPFQVCCSGTLFFTASPFRFLPGPQITTKRDFTYPFAYTLLFAVDFWQPPKIV